MKKLAWLLCVFVLACADAEPPTQVVVIIDAEQTVRAQATDLSLVITDVTNGASRTVNDDRQSPARRDFPHRILLVPNDDDATRTYRVEATALGAQKTTLAVARLISGYVARQTRYVRVVLEDACINTVCGQSQTCDQGTCVDAARTPTGFAPSEDTAPVSTDVPAATAAPAASSASDAGAVSARDARVPSVPESTSPPESTSSPESTSPEVSGVTASSASRQGPYAVQTYTSGFADAPGYADATIHVPMGATSPLPGLAFVPGFLAAQSTIQKWGPFLASHGIVVITIGTNSTSDTPPIRSAALLDALKTLGEENVRPGSPLQGKLDTARLALAGWSMGGGGALIAAQQTPSLKAVMTLCPWNPGASYANLTVPTLFLAAEFDELAAGQSQSFYDSIPSSTPKLLWERAGATHFDNDPSFQEGAMGRYGLSFLKVFLEGDERYRPLLRAAPPNASDYRSNM